MGKTDDEIYDLYVQRRGLQGVVINRMRDMQTAVNGDTVVLIRDMDKAQKPAVANLIKQSLDQLSMRIAGVEPIMDWPALRPHIDASAKLAAQRRMAAYGWWQAAALSRKDRRRARHLIGYGMTVAAVRPDVKRGIPAWDVRNPLTTFPAPNSDPDDLLPLDTIFVYSHTLGWARRAYPVQYEMLRGRDSKLSDVIEVVEYNDDQETVLLACARTDYSNTWQPAAYSSVNKLVRLDQYPNLTNRPRVVVAGRITLDKPMGQFDGVLPLYQQRAHLAALEVIAVERGIFPDMVLEGFPNSNQQPVLVSGDWQDGRTGNINVLQNGTAKTLAMNPGVFGTQAVDRLQQAEMQESSTPAEFGGLSPTNIRTNARGQAVTAMTIDHNIQEAQDILGAAHEEENRIAVAVAKAWFGDAPKSFYVNFKNAKGPVTYTPNTTFETDNNTVTYPLSGTDAQNLTIGIESLVGAELMSQETARFLHPMIDDPAEEGRRVTLESLRKTGLTLLEQQAASGQMALTDYLAVVDAFKARGMTVEDAMADAHDQAQKTQAAQAQLPPQPGSPEAQPGINGQAGQPPVGPPPQGTVNVAQLLGALHRQAS